jgi:hypothetical protein
VIAAESSITSITRAQFANSLRNPSDELRSWLDVVDDTHEAILLGTNFVESRTVAGRAVLGARPTTDITTAPHEAGGDALIALVARFVDGMPCGVSGVVVPAGVAVFDPTEIVILRDTQTRQLFFAGSSNHWWPDEETAEHIRAAARRVGEGLAATAGYSGFFSLDGILGPDGFVATDVDPGPAAGLGLSTAAPDFPIHLFARSLGDQPALFTDVDPALVEDEIRRAVRRRPSFSLRLPARQENANCPGCASAPTRTADCGVTYRERCDAVAVVAAEPVGPQRLLGPAVAELGRELGWRGPWTSSVRPAR